MARGMEVFENDAGCICHNIERERNMGKNLKMFITGFLTSIFLMGVVAGVVAAGNDLGIQAVLSNSIKLKLNGQDWTPQDPSTGDYYKPIIYNGRTYLPVRAVLEEAAGTPVDYESATNTVWIGGRNDVINENSGGRAPIL